MSQAENIGRRVLVIDDEPLVHEAFRNVLGATAADHSALDALEAEIFGGATSARPSGQPSFEVSYASQGQQGCELAAAAVAEGKPYSLAFVDMRMPPGWDGLQTIERLWQVDPGLEVVICSAYSDHPWEKLVARLGFSEHLLILKKPFEDVEVRQLACALSQKRHLAKQAALRMQDLQEMVEARTAELRQANDRLQEEVAARTAAEEKLKYDALHDGLTGLPNRVLLTERIERCLERAKREEDYRYALLFLDLDNFKLINDTVGHTVGDQLLVEVAQRLQSCLRALDTASRLKHQMASRLGGDEFVVLLDGMKSPENAEQVAHRLLRAVSQPAMIAGQEVHVSVSIGLAQGSREYMVPDEILRDADAALYNVKAEGKGRVGVFNQAIREQIVTRLRLSNDLRRAIESHQLRLLYQPIVELESGRVESFEVLLRWNHPSLGAVSPALFIPIAEETGSIQEVGLWVLKESCRQLRIWHDEFPEHRKLSVSVNVSAKQFGDSGFPAAVERVLVETGLKPSDLNLEITESALMAREDASKLVEAVRAKGVGLHLDDFGTGYSSLSYLDQLPFDAIKIDRSFVRDMSLDRRHANIVQAIQTMAVNRRMRVIAEGIESLDQLVQLQTLDCSSGQGFFFSRPVEAPEARQLLERGGRLQPVVGREAEKKMTEAAKL